MEFVIKNRTWICAETTDFRCFLFRVYLPNPLHPRWIGNSSHNPHPHYTLCTHSCQVPLCANPHQPFTSGQRPLLFGVRKDLMRVTAKKFAMPAIQIWHNTPLTAPRQRLVHTNPRSTACAISTAHDYHPNVWSNSSSGIGSTSTPALCPNRSYPASDLRFAVCSNSSSGIATNTASGAASRCANSISSSGERAGAIAGAIVGSPTCSSICRTVVGAVAGTETVGPCL